MKTDAFALRHIGPRETDLQHMLKTIGVDSIEQLVYETLPDDIRLKAPLNLDPAMTEYEFANHIQELGKKNKVFKSYIGLGYHPTIVPHRFREIFSKTQDGILPIHPIRQKLHKVVLKQF